MPVKEIFHKILLNPGETVWIRKPSGEMVQMGLPLGNEDLYWKELEDAS